MRFSAVILMTISSIFASAALAQSPKLAVEEMMVPSSDAGIEIYVRNKRPADMTSFRPERHRPLCAWCDLSGIDRLRSATGWHVLDGLHRVPGLRRLSAGPARLRQVDAAEGNERQAGSQRARRAGETAVKDISSVVDFILKRRDIDLSQLILFCSAVFVCSERLTCTKGLIVVMGSE